ncbi:hypothetical protein F6X40_09495 [Paraburkholderia sp. UCT31]|uniref:hypothetical protein n=1 Tax=Paraburkholderia sp. UCT31 TaxID=2615209 RepID=UPI001655148D|nr:hypothetical protein [Paraburkholderia sp. UCT31]MBC8737042.1 hypothetical protein [Paraburkholderia sp. UCT31]
MTPTYDELTKLLERYQSAARDVMNSGGKLGGESLLAVWGDTRRALEQLPDDLDEVTPDSDAKPATVASRTGDCSPPLEGNGKETVYRDAISSQCVKAGRFRPA